MSLLRDKNGLTEAEYLANYDGSKYPRPSLTADIAVFWQKAEGLYLLLIRRGGHPYLGCWALPGGFADANEELLRTAQRELEEETCLTDVPLLPVGLFSTPGRDPRGWTVSQAYTALIRSRREMHAADDAAQAEWFRVELAPDSVTLTCGEECIHIPLYLRSESGRQVWAASREALAFDHAQILAQALQTLQLLPPKEK